ncbi:uncharacterized protein LACBIDRAFT_302940 [Laccaria bicolor S238N-H82]|uniref:Predicted protein n=1 Tax=Laccaria bicolor (strain S238N-H82 / ATCC MYA-4686) TaxID=486041 RepID=B0DIN5_LACBS|nr:uncharacterized protein LACBIDRAFT_302940 [Laccaria bicolor S238N-H82]EDR05715.1 predicted protein [Laccaria bicolor S238N-H82]|eukprot:XP_001883819.1 predicted protein [Laccaria bicolor S238N-H82]
MVESRMFGRVMLTGALSLFGRSFTGANLYQRSTSKSFSNHRSAITWKFGARRVIHPPGKTLMQNQQREIAHSLQYVRGRVPSPYLANSAAQTSKPSPAFKGRQILMVRTSSKLRNVDEDIVKIVNEDMKVWLLDTLGKGKGQVCLENHEYKRRAGSRAKSGEDSERRFGTLQALCSVEPSFMGHICDTLRPQASHIATLFASSEGTPLYTWMDHTLMTSLQTTSTMVSTHAHHVSPTHSHSLRLPMV